ncbi:MAG TPA: hypothetical protein ENK02_13600 [Planctomycetes bacterium]|nr:hypothetical protein [Planctomycetota bacterium]
MPDPLDLLRIIGPLALLFLVGASLLRLFGIRFRSDPLAYLGWAFGSGCLGTGVILFAWLWTAPDLRSPLVPDLLLGAAALVLFLLSWILPRATDPLAPEEQNPSSAPTTSVAPSPPWVRLERGFFVLVVLAVLGIVLLRIASASLEPMVANDEAGIWSQKAKVLWLSGGFNEHYPKLLDFFPTPQKDYPLLNPILQVFEFVNWGRITLIANRLPFQALSLASVLVLAGSLRGLLRPSLAALVLLMVASWRLFAWESFEGDGEVLVVFGSLMALDGWLRYRSGENRTGLPVLAIGLSVLAWSKNEALMIAAALCLAALLHGLLTLARKKPLPKPTKALFVLIPPLLILGLGRAVNAHFGFESPWARDPRGTLLDFFLNQFWDYGPIVLRYFRDEVFFYQAHSGFVALALLAWLLVFPKRLLLDGTIALPGLALLGTWIAVMAVFVATPAEVHWHLITAAKRVAFQTMPACALLLAAAATRVSPFLRPWRPASVPMRVELSLPS